MQEACGSTPTQLSMDQLNPGGPTLQRSRAAVSGTDPATTDAPAMGRQLQSGCHCNFDLTLVSQEPFAGRSFGARGFETRLGAKRMTRCSAPQVGKLCKVRRFNENPIGRGGFAAHEPVHCFADFG